MSRSRASGLGLNLLLAVGAVVVVLALVEAALQVASLVYRSTRSGGAEATAYAPRKGDYRVLCLGESTTRGFGAKPYPRILEEQLNRRGFGTSFSVYNAGYTSRASPWMVRVLPKLIEQVDPDMVIVMMGINDQFYFTGTDRLGLPMGVQLLLLESRLYKLLRLAWFRLRARSGEDAVRRAMRPGPTKELAEFRRSFRVADLQWLERRLEDPERTFRAFIRTARKAGTPGAAASIDIPPGYRRSYYNAYLHLTEFYLEHDRAEEAVALYREAIRVHPDVELFYRGLSGVYDKVGNRELAEEYRKRSEELADSQVLAVTRDSFRALYDIVRGTEIEFVAMQYPLRSVSRLEYLLANAADVAYVDNEEAFREAVAEWGYEEIFIDRFAGDFGHCSARGNRLMVENLIAAVFEPMFGNSRERSVR